MIVEPEGPEDAKIVVIADAPGADEDKIGRPFVGAAGAMLFNEFLGRAGIKRRECLVMYVYWEKPPYGNKFETIPDPTYYYEDNWEWINRHPRNVILAVGEHALQFVSQFTFTGITKYRGSVLRTEGVPCAYVSMIHPKEVFKNYSWKILCRMDAKRAKLVLDQPGISDLKRKIITLSSESGKFQGSKLDAFTSLMEHIEDYQNAHALAFDIETYNRTITCIGMARGVDHAVVAPLTGELDRSQTRDLIRAVAKVLDCDMPKIGQNLDYDVQYLYQTLNIGVRNVWLDTMVAHAAMHPEMGHSLDLLTSLYTLHPYYKDMRKESITGDPSAVRDDYNGTDCCVTFEVGMELYKELISTGTREFFDTIQMPVTKSLIRMERRGIRINESLRDTRTTDLESEVEADLVDPILEGLNPRSSKQVIAWLRGKGLNPSSKGKPSADVHVLRLIKNRKPGLAPFINAVIGLRQKQTLISKYLKVKLNNGRIHCSYKTTTTDTGRISSKADTFDYGTNLQNIPKSQRDWFVPDSGLLFWEADASQIEARITAWLSGDENYIRGYLDDERDLHSENAMGLFGIPLDDVEIVIEGSENTYRDVGKTATHAMNYMCGPKTLKDKVNEEVPSLPFSMSTAKEFIDTFKSMRPALVSWWTRTIDHVKKDRRMVTPFGRQRIFLGRATKAKDGTDKGNLFESAVAFMPQSIAADHINSALVRIERRLDEIQDADILLQVHDSIGGQCKPEDVELVKGIVVEEMEKPLPLEWQGHVLRVPAEFESGANWKECG